MRRVCVVAAVVGLVVAAGATAVAVQTYRDADTPEAAVRTYFDALARGDAATALAAGALPEGGRALVTDAVLQGTLAVAPITDLATGAVSRNGDSATVAVRYRLGGASPQEVDDAVDLVRAEGRWRLAHSAVAVTLSVADAASWAAVPSEQAPFAVPEDTQLVFPGAVPVVYRSPVLEVEAAARIVRLAGASGAANAMSVTAQVTEAGRQELTATVVAALSACAAGGDDVDPFCPQPPAGRMDGAVLRSVPQSFAGTLSGLDRVEPVFAVGPESSGAVNVSGSVDAEGDWQVLAYDNVAQDRDGSTTITFSGTVAVGATDSLTWERA